MPARAVICTGMIDRIGLDASNISYKTNADSIEESMFKPAKIGGNENATKTTSRR
jgi:hypothetical protein